MDLSAVIFVVLALAWAVYLIPKALSHHDELASDRLVEGHSDKVRILSRTRTVTTSETVVEDVVDAAEPVAAPAVEAPAGAAAPVVLTRASARRAARNRRRVLAVLTAVLVVVAGLAAAAVLPWWSVAVPAALVVAFLVVARLSVRRTQRARHASAPRATLADRVRESTDAELAPAEADPIGHVDVAEQALAQLAEDATGADREDLEAALADDGSLWDPLPMTLPTYVNKARARRTVRTIELTGINSSGHDDSASALAREAEHDAAQATARAAETDESHRRVVGG